MRIKILAWFPHKSFQKLYQCPTTTTIVKNLLPDLQVPYPDAPPVRTLIIDLESTLVYSTYSRAAGWRVEKRPGTEAFLAYIASFFELVVFTSNMVTYADPILDRLDPNRHISQRLYQAEMHYKNGVHVTDLSNINRELTRTLVIYNYEIHVSMQPDNSIIIPKWTGDPYDITLLDLIPLLEGVVREDMPDVREVAALLRNKPLAVGVEEYRAMEGGRAKRSRSTSFFGRVGPVDEAVSHQPVPKEVGWKEDECKDEDAQGAKDHHLDHHPHDEKALTSRRTSWCVVVRDTEQSWCVKLHSHRRNAVSSL